MAYSILKSYKLKFTPFEIFTALRQEKNCFFLDSSLNANLLGRYSFLGIDPFYILETKGEDPLPKLREILARYKVANHKNGPPFLGGAVGYLAYDLGFILEKKLKIKPKPSPGIPDCLFAFYNTVIILDHLKKITHISSVGFPEKKYRLEKTLCESNVRKIERLLSRINTCESGNGKNKPQNKPLGLKSNFTKEGYILAVKKAKEYIRRGDIYQVNLAQEFQAQATLSGWEIYRRLRKISPSYFSSYFDAGGQQILSSSPEGFLRLQAGRVTTRPMKGTRARSQNRIKDAKLKKELLDSAKDKAELAMIVDLERNDLGRVCNYDSIKVDTFRQLEEYSTVFQTTASVYGSLHKNKDNLDLIRACFPGGSITGCPKIRAMEIIEELEPSRRSIYTGCLGYLSFCGNMDLNILIRTILKKEDKLYFSVGGGIVADSRPQAEYEETLVKAKAMMEAINAL
ncbi:MAG: aminodeoxychorismate synthase component I [Candidatus Omnitrophica bacterium]|nr:aminodeoxychorismate synthase component I [Candidatus Omnitrophota bacterium]MDD5592537.1 aminodeoxychorismate synthase component I [Candidatus Omnitrophota bacterium]